MTPKLRAKITLDIIMTIIFMFVMSYQITESLCHEILGTILIVLFFVHNFINIKWYGSLNKGKLSFTRILWIVINLALLVMMILTAFSGMVISSYVFPFVNLDGAMSVARTMHIACSYWTFVLCGCHVGLHWGMAVGMMGRSIRSSGAYWWILRLIATAIAFFGAVTFCKLRISSYIFLQAQFVFLDYEKAAWLVLSEYCSIFVCFAYIVYYLMGGINVLRNKNGKKARGIISAAIAIAVLLISFSGAFAAEKSNMVLIKGGTFRMGSPKSENWRVDDEAAHDVTVNDFYMSVYEVTGKEYEAIMKTNPSRFKGSNLPVESVSWLDAVRFCNAKSNDEGLTPVYKITETSIEWDRNANGYRLPTEAEWEYACRAGTATPFNAEHSLSPKEANYYGHYPYEIEENYFDTSKLTAKPGEYRERTVAVDSFAPNAWGLYNMHGNVGEWVWDLYGKYDEKDSKNPVGASKGNRRVYRGGGWNDFAKNMRSAYRAMLNQNDGAYNIGIRLVRNADGTSSLPVVKNDLN